MRSLVIKYEQKPVILCNYRSKRINTLVIAYIINGKLIASSLDFGPTAYKIWGFEGMTIWYQLDVCETSRCIELLHRINKPLQEALVEKFGDDEYLVEFPDFCDKNGIKYERCKHVTAYA